MSLVRNLLAILGCFTLISTAFKMFVKTDGKADGKGDGKPDGKAAIKTDSKASDALAKSSAASGNCPTCEPADPVLRRQLDKVRAQMAALQAETAGKAAEQWDAELGLRLKRTADEISSARALVESQAPPPPPKAPPKVTKAYHQTCSPKPAASASKDGAGVGSSLAEALAAKAQEAQVARSAPASALQATEAHANAISDASADGNSFVAFFATTRRPHVSGML